MGGASSSPSPTAERPQECCACDTEPSHFDEGFAYYDARVTGGDIYGDTAKLYITKGHSSRVAFEGRVAGGDPCHCATMASQCSCVFKNGDQVQMKIANRETSCPGIRISLQDMRARELARQIVRAFNAQLFVTKKAYVHAGLLLKITNNHTDQRVKQRLNLYVGEHILIDNNNFPCEKFNSNNGWSSQKYDLPDFLSHWSYENSNGKHLLTGLQGYRGVPGSPRINGSGIYYFFKDPVIMSRKQGIYGSSDLGHSGMKKWMKAHKCNRLCKRFILPRVPELRYEDESGAVRDRPPHPSSTAYMPLIG